MNGLVLGLVVGLAGAVAWLAYELLRLRREGGPAGGGGSPAALTTGFAEVESDLAELRDRVGSLEVRISRSIQNVGAVAYDAYGDVAGSLSRSIAFVSDDGTGVVITQLVGRNDTRFFIKGVSGGVGEEPLSPEEEAALRRALGG